MCKAVKPACPVKVRSLGLCVSVSAALWDGLWIQLHTCLKFNNNQKGGAIKLKAENKSTVRWNLKRPTSPVNALKIDIYMYMVVFF